MNLRVGGEVKRGGEKPEKGTKKGLNRPGRNALLFKREVRTQEKGERKKKKQRVKEG